MIEQKEEEYYVCVGALSTTVYATNIDDGIILAKARAIEKGYINPKTISVKLSDGTMIYYCGGCHLVPVGGENRVCKNCPPELALENGNEKSELFNAPLTPEEATLTNKKYLPQRPMAFDEFLKEFGGRWDTHDSGGFIFSEKQFYEVQCKLEELRKNEGHLMGIDFGEFCTKYCLRFSLDFLSQNEAIEVYTGVNGRKQSFKTMKEVFTFFRKEVERHFKLVS